MRFSRLRCARFWLAVAAAGLGLAVQPVQAARPEVVIDPGGVPPAALQAIIGAVDSITRLAEDQDGGEVSRLRRRARDATLSALATEGYFSAYVDLTVGQDHLGETWDISIEPGERTVVEQVDIRFAGKITDPGFADRVSALKDEWPLDKGMPFINETWSSAKSGLMSNVSRKDFYLARMRSSRATVMADEATARLEIDVDSGPRVRMGKLTLIGLKRVPEKLIDRYVKYSPGEPYDQDRLDDWQQALQATAFFRGAFVMMDSSTEARVTRPDGDLEMPVVVRVTEAASRVYTASLGVDSDNGARVEGLYRQNVVFGQPVWIETGAGIDKNRQRFFYDVHLPPDDGGYTNSVGVLASHSDIEGVDTTRYAAGWLRKQTRQGAGSSRVEYETQWSLTAAHDDTKIDGAQNYKVPTLVAGWQWLRRDVNDKYDPREGNLIDLGLGAGVTLDRGQPFYKSSIRAQQWWPIGKRDVLTVRAEVGKVWSQTERLPEDFGFRTGGSRSIRGYKYNSIGLSRGDAIVGAPAMAWASIEYMHFFTEQLGMTVFLDAGDAATSFGDMKMHLGYGAGAVLRTPAGPFSVELAYGQRDRKLRLHFSLGVAF
ncbi:MAG: BamA/TamA family outer membrane protein [Pusillimonas sp.]